MGYLDDNGLARLWSKIKAYVTNNHKSVSTNESNSGIQVMTFGDTFAYSNLYQIAKRDEYGHVTMMVESPAFTLPNVECGTFTKDSGNVTVEFVSLKKSPKIIKIYLIGSDQSTSGLSTVYSSDATDIVLSRNGTVTSVNSNGFSFAGAPGTFLWEAWG